MAARTRKIFVDDRTREKIRTTQLIKRLQHHIFSEKDPITGQVVKLDATQIKAIEILLRKSMPDLSAVEGQMNMTVSHDEAIKEIETALAAQPSHVVN